jgi:hypothetical protein
VAILAEEILNICQSKRECAIAGQAAEELCVANTSLVNLLCQATLEVVVSYDI